VGRSRRRGISKTRSRGTCCARGCSTRSGRAANSGTGQQLANAWDFRVFVDVPLEEALRRGVERDSVRFGSRAEARRRYLPAQRLYLERVRPRELADVVVENADPASPRLL
jgi:hypothetical protein